MLGSATLPGASVSGWGSHCSRPLSGLVNPSGRSAQELTDEQMLDNGFRRRLAASAWPQIRPAAVSLER
jgi:hypothetical protein